MKKKQISIVLEMDAEVDEFETCKKVREFVNKELAKTEFVKSFTKMIYVPN